MKRQSLLIAATLMCGIGAVAQTLPEGMTALLPAGVTANISQNKQLYAPKNLCVAGSPDGGYKAFFQAKDADHGEELWVTDGTPAGTRMVKDINPGVATSDIQYITRFNDKVVFSATDGECGYELWISDGTEDGTFMVKDIHELDSSNPVGFCQIDEGHLVFYATDFESETFATKPQQWLWITDGTEEGTVLVKQVDCVFPGQEEADNRWGANMRVGRRVFFKAEEADKDATTHGVELWVTDGTEDGTYLVKDINTEPNVDKPGSTLSPALAHMQNFYNEKVFFKAWSIESGNEPWASDGTEAGTYEIYNTIPTVGANGLGNGGGVTMTGEPYNGMIIFRTTSPTYGSELGVTTCEKGNYRVFDIRTQEPTQDMHSWPDAGVVFDGVYMFCANTGTDATREDNHGGELHCFDGEKVWMQSDLGPGAAGCNWVKEPLVAGGSLYWWNEGSLDGTGATNTKLIRLDSKEGTPVVVSNIDANGDKVYGLRNLNGDLLFTSAVTNQLYCYHYRKPGYDPAKDADVMEPEYRTRAEIAAAGIETPVIDDMTVTITPNPVVDSFIINTGETVTLVEIYNLAGVLVESVENPADNTVNVNGLGKGYYMVNVACGSTCYHVKMIVK